MSLDRFHRAQASAEAGYATALAELRDGAKTSHWIWYVFPQLQGLGASDMAQRFALRDLAEAEEYLRDPVLGARYAELAQVVEDQLTRGVPLVKLMGSSIDARKLASSLTLFRAAAERVGNAPLSALADRLLQRTAAAGSPACTSTLTHIAETSRKA